MTRQFFVERDGEGWAVRASDGRNTVTVQRYAEQAEAVRIASGANARSLQLAPPARRTPTAAEIRAAFDGLGATPIAGRRWVHHKNQHTD